MIGKLFRWLLALVVVAGLLGAGSYAAARFTAGRVVGPRPPLGGRTIHLAYNGVEELSGKPVAWVIAYTSSQLPGVRRVIIYVSPSGKLLGTRPADLDRRIEAWNKEQMP